MFGRKSINEMEIVTDIIKFKEINQQCSSILSISLSPLIREKESSVLNGEDLN